MTSTAGRGAAGALGLTEVQSTAILAAAVFFVAFALRLAFWQATPDASWPGSAYYPGDASMWARYAGAPAADGPFPFGLPLRPPGTALLLAALGGRIVLAKLVWCALGAGSAALLFVAARPCGLLPALSVGLGSAAATQLMIVSTSLNNETPYLFLVAVQLTLWRPLTERAGPLTLVAWGSANALACLVRTEHVLFTLLASALLAAGWWRRESAAAGGWRGALVAFSFVVTLLPWQLDAWAHCDSFNHDEPMLPPAVEQAYSDLEHALSTLHWSSAARSEAARLPAFCRRPMALFVAATVATRGGRRIEAKDFQILDEAFGYRPEPVPARPFVALYGGLNFYLANHAEADGGFSRRPLEQPPPLTGGAHRYPAALLRGLPPDDLSLSYPPHLEAVNRGYRLGLEQIAAAPLHFARLVAGKLAHAWAGAAPTLGGWALPLGDDGLRRRVDLVVATGPAAVAWRLGWLALALAGLPLALRLPAARPWLLFLVARLVVIVAFYGYARQGALALPAVLLLAGLVIERATRRWPMRRLLTVVGLLTVLTLATEAVRSSTKPVVFVDDQPIEGNVLPRLDEPEDRRLRIQTF